MVVTGLLGGGTDDKKYSAFSRRLLGPLSRSILVQA
jgi:hypothetical protein